MYSTYEYITVLHYDMYVDALGPPRIKMGGGAQVTTRDRKIGDFWGAKRTF